MRDCWEVVIHMANTISDGVGACACTHACTRVQRERERENRGIHVEKEM